MREAPYDHPRGRRGRPRKPSPGEGPSDAGTQPRLPEPDQGVRALWEALQLRKEPRPHSVNLAALSEKEVGALRRAEGRAFPRDPSAEALVAWASRAEPRVRNVGRDSVAVLLPLARRLAEALLAGPQAAGQGEGAVPAVTFLGPPLALHELDAALAADLDLLLTRAGERRSAVLACRWGLGTQPVPLRVLAQRWGVTRERIRQIAVPFEAWLPRSLRVHIRQIEACIGELDSSRQIGDQVPILRRRFFSDALLLAFLDRCSRLPLGTLAHRMAPPVHGPAGAEAFAGEWPRTWNPVSFGLVVSTVRRTGSSTHRLPVAIPLEENPPAGREEAARKLAEVFADGGHLRGFPRRLASPLTHRGYELRFVTHVPGETQQIIEWIRQLGFRPGRPHRKGLQWRIPVYGYAQVAQLLRWIAPGRLGRRLPPGVRPDYAIDPDDAPADESG